MTGLTGNIVAYGLATAAGLGVVVAILAASGFFLDTYRDRFPEPYRAYVREQIVPTSGTLVVTGLLGWTLVQPAVESAWALVGILAWVVFVRHMELKRIRRKLVRRNTKLYEMTGDYQYFEL